MAAPQSMWRRALREPLVQFALPAALIFSLNASVARDDDARIHVTPEIVATLVEERALVLGRELAEVERTELVEQFVADEILLREALARGLDRRDGKVREHLVNKMAFLLDEEPPEPQETELAAFYRDHPELYTTRPSLSLQHAYFPEAPSDPGRVLAELRAGAPPETVGEPFYLGAHLGYITLVELGVVLGDGFALAVGQLEADTWSGPIESARGLHFVRVTEKHPARRLPIEDLAYRLRDDWQNAWREDLREQRLAELRRHYEVVVARGEEAR